MENLSLFSTKPDQSGYRLYTFQAYNWGTFDNNIWSIDPAGETSLLTGANASGKTTLVDGLLTLLVPEKRMRFYNQTSGSKGERTEESYVFGEYGETENTENRVQEIKKLRPNRDKTQSVLLAVFQSDSRYVTLAQVRWFSGSGLKRAFIISHNQLSIAEDFMPIDNNGDWKKRLKSKYGKLVNKNMVEIIDSPREYGRIMRKLFGMRSEKSHTLFSQTIGLKVLGNLDEFVRQQMLEEPDSETEFQKVKTYFKTLSEAHLAIEKAHKQIALLVPIKEKAERLGELKTHLSNKTELRETAPLWFSLKQKELIQAFNQEQEAKKKSREGQREEINSSIEKLREEERELDMQIRNDEIGSQISRLEKENKELEKTRTKRDSQLKQYNHLAKRLDLQPDPQSRELFEEQQKTAQLQEKKIKKHQKENSEEVFHNRRSLEQLEEQYRDVSKEISVLRSQKNNITGPTSRIRQKILEAVDATEKEIPFIGELIKVREENREWEPVIEKLLHSFALCLIVPEEYYSRVNHFVKEHDLKGRIIYYRYNKKETAPTIFQQLEEDEVIHKLDIRPSIYAEWVRQQILNRFNYLCVESLDAFQLADKAITREGLIRSGIRHEKDDRPEVKGRHKYVLGWDNKEKIQMLVQVARDLDKQVQEAKERKKELLKMAAKIEETLHDLVRFLDFKEYQDINWWSIATKIQSNKNRIDELENTNERLVVLKTQRTHLLEEIKVQEKNRDDLSREIYDLENSIEQQEGKLQHAKMVIEAYPKEGIEEKLQAFEAHVSTRNSLSIQSLEGIETEVKEGLEAEINKMKDDIRDQQSKVERLMRIFKNPDREIVEKFPDWNSDTHLLGDQAEFIDEYVALLERIEKEELAEYREQFRKYLNEEMITKMADFQTWLERHEEDIEENIEALNKSLAKINFRNNPPTFIKLTAEKDYSPKVKDFRVKLNDWKPNMVEYHRTKDEQILETSFTKIKELLDNLTEAENLRKEVLDVRNWLKFKAVEHYREDSERVFRRYTGTAKLSGGEGAQLTYTILGSAIAYQFGIHSEGLNTNSFRFICVDEAFSKQDDEKARFLMELCKQLHLQVMVVSPAKAEEVAIVEPYIAQVHFVQRKDNRHSVVFDMPIKQLKEERKAFLENTEEVHDYS